MEKAELEAQIEWSPVYNPGWDDAPDEYAARGLVGWGRSRRLGRLDLPAGGGRPAFKAYVGVQHVDPGRAGWQSFDVPEARFFVSWFAAGQCLGLRTFPTLSTACEQLWQAYLRLPAVAVRPVAPAGAI